MKTVLDKRPQAYQIPNTLQIICERYEIIKNAVTAEEHPINNPAIFEKLYEWDCKTNIDWNCSQKMVGPFLLGIGKCIQEVQQDSLLVTYIKIEEYPECF